MAEQGEADKQDNSDKEWDQWESTSQSCVYEMVIGAATRVIWENSGHKSAEILIDRTPASLGTWPGSLKQP